MDEQLGTYFGTRARPRARRTVVWGTVVRVHDGDTLIVRCPSPQMVVRLGHPIRLARVNAAERGTEAGEAAKEALAEILPVGTRVSVRVEEVDRYGRWVAEVKVGGESLSDFVLRLGGSEPWARD